jgi:nitroreductase
MEVYDAMRTTFAARDYTDDKVNDETLYRILDNARFAPSGGNRQGWRVLVVKDTGIRTAMRELMQPTIKQYKAQAGAGETPFSTIGETRVTAAEIDAMPPAFPLVDDLETAPALLVICVDLSLVTSFDKDLDRIGVISGASVYPFAWNILLSARNEGLGGVLTTFLANQEPEARVLLSIPDNYAVAAMIALGKPEKQLTRLKRNPVESFTWVNDFKGESFQ